MQTAYRFKRGTLTQEQRQMLIERRRRALSLRLAGYTLAEIGNMLGVEVYTVCRDVRGEARRQGFELTLRATLVPSTAA